MRLSHEMQFTGAHFTVVDRHYLEPVPISGMSFNSGEFPYLEYDNISFYVLNLEMLSVKFSQYVCMYTFMYCYRYKANVERRDHCGNTTLHYAVASDDPKLVEWLLKDKNMHEQINSKNTVSFEPVGEILT